MGRLRKQLDGCKQKTFNINVERTSHMHLWQNLLDSSKQIFFFIQKLYWPSCKDKVELHAVLWEKICYPIQSSSVFGSLSHLNVSGYKTHLDKQTWQNSVFKYRFCQKRYQDLVISLKNKPSYFESPKFDFDLFSPFL